MVNEDFNAHPKQATKHVSPLAILVTVSECYCHMALLLQDSPGEGISALP